jgi:hypothetical protein
MSIHYISIEPKMEKRIGGRVCGYFRVLWSMVQQPWGIYWHRGQYYLGFLWNRWVVNYSRKMMCG